MNAIPKQPRHLVMLYLAFVAPYGIRYIENGLLRLGDQLERQLDPAGVFFPALCEDY
jgi:hypothetical protein